MSGAIQLYSGSASGGAGPFEEVANISDFRAKSGIVSTMVYVRGYYQNGDGGEGFFYIDTSDTTSPDDGGSVIIDAEGNRWKRIFDGPVSVKHFGAVGDQVTDDTIAIQAACDFAYANGIGAVYFPAGDYLVSSVNIFRNTKYYGDGPGKTTIHSDNTNAPVFVSSSYTGYNSVSGPGANIEIRDIGFVHPNSKETRGDRIAIRLFDSDVLIDNIRVDSFPGGGIHFKAKDALGNYSGVALPNITIVNSAFVDGNYDQIKFDMNSSYEYININNIYMSFYEDLSFLWSRNGIVIRDAKYINISNVNANNINESTILIDASYYVTMSNININNNNINNRTGYAIVLGYIKESVIMSNIDIKGQGNGIYAKGSPSGRNRAVIVNGLTYMNTGVDNKYIIYNAGNRVEVRVFGLKYTPIYSGNTTVSYGDVIAVIDPPTLDSSGKLVERLSYENVPNGVATLDANGIPLTTGGVPVIEEGSNVNGSYIKLLGNRTIMTKSEVITGITTTAVTLTTSVTVYRYEYLWTVPASVTTIVGASVSATPKSGGAIAQGSAITAYLESFDGTTAKVVVESLKDFDELSPLRIFAIGE